MSGPLTRSRSATSSKGSGAPEAGGATFVEWVPGMPGSYDAVRKTSPRLYHKKSRTGCQQCRARRVKCDETHPICGGCRRNKHECVYSRLSGKTVRSESGITKTGKPEANTSDNAGSMTALGFPESRKRRFLELKLLHRYLTKTSATMLGPTESILSNPFATVIPGLALEHDTLFYSICAVSAFHLAKDEPRNLEAIETCQRYLDLALREHRNEVAHLSKANADAVCLTTVFLRVCAFSMLQDRPLNPYTPPAQWLQMTTGSAGIFKQAWPWINDEASIARGLFMKRTPILASLNETLYQESNRRELLYLLRRSDASEPWDADIEEAYTSTISYLGGIQIAISAHEAPADVCRRLILFPVLAKKRFIELIEEQQPRALVILAHFFALLNRFREYWWLGEAGKREVYGIQAALPDEWQYLMSWPLAAVEEGSLPVQ